MQAMLSKEESTTDYVHGIAISDQNCECSSIGTNFNTNKKNVKTIPVPKPI